MCSVCHIFEFLASKNERLQRVEKYIDTVHKLSTILGLDSTTIISEVHPSLNDLCGISKNTSNSVLAKLNGTVESLEEEKKRRLEKVIIIYAFDFVLNAEELHSKHLHFNKTCSCNLFLIDTQLHATLKLLSK